MRDYDSPPKEPVYLERRLSRIWSDFEHRLTSVDAAYLLYGSFSGHEDLAQRFMAVKGKQSLLDKRRRLTESEQDFVDDVMGRAYCVERYVNWLRQEGAQPLHRDLLVGYCAAFENALKEVALAFRLAKRATPREIWKTGFVVTESQEASERDGVASAWKVAGEKRRNFFRDQVRDTNPDFARWAFDDPESDKRVRISKPARGIEIELPSPAEHWAAIEAAFLLRNQVLHSNGWVGKMQIEAGDVVFASRSEVDVTWSLLQRTYDAMCSVLHPINPEQL